MIPALACWHPHLPGDGSISQSIRGVTVCLKTSSNRNAEFRNMFQPWMLITASNKPIFRRYFMKEKEKEKRKRKSIYSFIVMTFAEKL